MKRTEHPSVCTCLNYRSAFGDMKSNNSLWMGFINWVTQTWKMRIFLSCWERKEQAGGPKGSPAPLCPPWWNNCLWIIWRATAKNWSSIALCLNGMQCPTQPFPKPCSRREPSFLEAAIIWKPPEAFSLFTFSPQFNSNFRAQGTIIAPVTFTSAEYSEWSLPKIQAWNPCKWSRFARLSKPTAAAILRW